MWKACLYTQAKCQWNSSIRIKMDCLAPKLLKMSLKNDRRNAIPKQSSTIHCTCPASYSLKTHQISASFFGDKLLHSFYSCIKLEMLLPPSPKGKHLFHWFSLETPLQIACCPKWHPHLEHRNSTFHGVVRFEQLDFNMWPKASSCHNMSTRCFRDWCCLQSSKKSWRWSMH